MTPGESHNEWYQYYCQNFYVFKKSSNAYSKQLLQTLNNVKSIQFSVVKQTFNNVKISNQYLYAKYSLFNLKGSNSEVKKMEFRLKSAFQ